MTQPTHDTTADAGEQVDREEFLVLVSQELTALDQNLQLVHQLVDTHQRGLGFATPDALEAMNQQIRAERKARHWNQQRGYYTGTGEMPAQGNITAWAFHTDVHLVLRHNIRRMVHALAKAGVCTTHQLPAEPTDHDLIRHVRVLSWDLHDTRRLDQLHDDLVWLNIEAQRLVDGHDRVRLDGACPHCDRKTLVVTFTDGVIRCDRDPHTGQYEDCVCPDGFCPCKTNPRHRHEWHRDKGTTSSGWWALADRLNLTKQITTKEP